MRWLTFKAINPNIPTRVSKNATVVIEILPITQLHTNVAGTIKLRTDLADFRGQHLVIVDEAAWERATGGQTRDGQVPTTSAEERCIALINLTQDGGAAFFDQFHGRHNGAGVDPLDRTHRVTGAPLGGRPILLNRPVVGQHARAQQAQRSYQQRGEQLIQNLHLVFSQ